MGIELPKDIKDMAIPLELDARGTGASLSSPYDRAKGEAAYLQQQEEALQYDMATADGITFVGDGKISGYGGAAVDAREVQREADKRSDNNREAYLLAASLKAAEDIAESAGKIARSYEEGFEAEFGTNWREDVALRVLDPDEYPIKGEHESQEDYDLRVEQAIIDKTIDPKTGEIKPEYKNHPTLGKYAEWAKARNAELAALKALDVLNDPDSTSEERQQSIDSLDKFAEQREFDQEHDQLTPELAADVGTQIQDRTDEMMDQTVSANSDMGFTLG